MSPSKSAITIAWCCGLASAGAAVGYGLSSDHAAAKQVGAAGLLLATFCAPILFLAEHKQLSAIARLGRIALAAIISGAIFFATGELALRLLWLDGQSFGSRGGPIVRRFERDFKFNGFDGPSRGPAPSERRVVDSNLILVQGDSLTWGQGVRDEEQLFTTRLLQNLNGTRDSAVEMAVLAYPGREIDGHVEQLEKWGGELQPDTIIYLWYVNDMELDKRERPARFAPWGKLFFHRTLWQRSYFWYFLDYSLTTLFPPSESYESYLLRCFGDGTPGWRTFEAQFSRWVGRAKQLTKNVFVALYPRMSRSGDHPAVPPEIERLLNQMAGLCDRYEVTCIDLSSALLQFREVRDISATPFDNHPGAPAHRAVADTLFQVLQAAREEGAGANRRGPQVASSSES